MSHLPRAHCPGARLARTLPMVLVAAVWAGGEAGAAAPDLTISCIQTSPADPNLFVDGQTVTMECLLENVGTASSAFSMDVVTVFSLDTAVDAGDTVIAKLEDLSSLRQGESLQVSLSGTPIFTVVGPRRICTKVDAVVGDLDDQDGRVTESDESNNVHCTRVEVLEAKKDLVVDPNSVGVTPDPADPNVFRAGLQLEVTYESLNLGIGAIRRGYINTIHLGATAAAALSDPNAILCSREVVFQTQGQFQPGGGAVPVSHGLGAAGDPETCTIPFGLPVGDYVLVIQVDSEDDINERAATGNATAAEANNTLALPLRIEDPLDPLFRIQHRLDVPTDQRVEITGPQAETMHISVSSARGLAGYSLTLGWDPPELLAVGDPNLPGGDPNQVVFTGFLETGGLAQSCSVTGIDPGLGRLGIACTTSDPGGSGAAAQTQKVRALVGVTLTPVLPGAGDLSISGLTALSSTGQPFAAPRTLDGRFVVDGPPDLSVTGPGLPTEAYPGRPFEASYRILNDGFGEATPPLVIELVLSRDPNSDPLGLSSPPLIACSQPEPGPLPAKSTASRIMTGCDVLQQLRPGLYTGLFRVRDEPDPNSVSVLPLPFPARIVALRKARKGRSLELHGLPGGPGGSARDGLGLVRKERSRHVTVVRSISRNLNWLVGMSRSRSGPGKLRVMNLPRGEVRKQSALTALRLPGRVKRLLGSADIDGDGEDELILLARSGRRDRVLDFRRVDFTQRKPEVCQSAAVTEPLPWKVVAATGIQHDGDPPDEIAVVTEDGALTIHDLALSGSLPPPAPCRPVPTLLEEAALATLVPVSWDSAFAGAGERVRAVCALDFQLDGVEEIASLHEEAAGGQALRILEPPLLGGGASILVAGDPEFGATGERSRARTIACTR